MLCKLMVLTPILELQIMFTQPYQSCFSNIIQMFLNQQQQPPPPPPLSLRRSIWLQIKLCFDVSSHSLKLLHETWIEITL